jgi:hypothetical protein
MSSIRMSETLRERIVRQGEAIFTASDERVRGNLAKDIHDRAANEFVHSELSIIAGIPDKWMGKVDHISYKLKYKLEGNDATHEMSWSETGLLKKIKIPMIYTLYSESYGDSKILNVPNGFLFSEGLSDEVGNWRNAVRRVEAERKTFLDELKRILKRTNTLKQFLDTWPQGENLVPNDVLAKLNEKPVREKKEPLMTEEASVALSTTLLKRTLMQ